MKKLLVLLALLTAAVPALSAEKTVAELNPDFVELMVQALRPKNEGAVFGYRNEVQPLSLFWFTDIHGDAEEFGRLIDFYNGYEKYFDGMICTGDLVCDSAEGSDFTYWSKTPGHEKVMSVIGNHDVLRHHNDDANKNRKDALSMAESYARYFAPFIDKWGAVYESGKTYYYRDYPKSKVRFIVLDCMLRRSQDKEAVEGQLRWFGECLTGARVKGYTVAVAYHFPMWESVRFEDSNFNWRSEISNAWYSELALFQAEVDRFKKKGGDFALWLGGHTHCDYTNISPDYPDQICVCVCAATRFKCVVMTRQEGTKSQDIANALIIDPDSGTFKVIRIGCDIDTSGVVRRFMTVDYKTGKVLARE